MFNLEQNYDQAYTQKILKYLWEELRGIPLLKAKKHFKTLLCKISECVSSFSFLYT